MQPCKSFDNYPVPSSASVNHYWVLQFDILSSILSSFPRHTSWDLGYSEKIDVGVIFLRNPSLWGAVILHRRPTYILCNSFRVDDEASSRCFGLWLDSNYDAYVSGKWLVDAGQEKTRFTIFLLKLTLLQLCKLHVLRVVNLNMNI